VISVITGSARAVRQKTDTKTANDFPKIFTFISPKKIDEVTQRCYWDHPSLLARHRSSTAPLAFVASLPLAAGIVKVFTKS